MAITVTVFVLMLCSRTVSESQQWNYPAETETLDFGSVPVVNYESNVYYDPGIIGFLFQLARTFLHVVQPNSFPHELIIEIIKQNYGQVLHQYQEPEKVVLTLQIIYYEIGFIICAIMGIVFILLMPLLGLCFCMCRCCDNCGGELHQRQKKNADCRRSCFATTLFFVTIIITAGTLCMFAANQNLTNQIKRVKELVNNNFQDLHSLLDYTPMQLNYIAQQYSIAKNNALSDINNIGTILGGNVKARFGKDVIPALEDSNDLARVTVDRAIKAIKETKEVLEKVATSRQTLDNATSKLQANLTDVRTSLNNTLNDAACKVPDAITHCDKIRDSLDYLNINANFSQLKDVDSELKKVSDVQKTDYEDLIQKGYSAFNNTPEVLQNETKSFASDAKRVLNEVEERISSLSREPGIGNIINTSTAYLNQGQRYFLEYFPHLEKYDFYRWLAGVALCCAVILILAFNYLGLLCGTCGFDKHASPTTRGCVSNTGGNLLLAGVGISFIFSWLMMLVVLVTFIAGGNIEKLVCQSLKDKSLFKVLDTPYLLNSHWKHFLSGFLFSEHNINLTFQSVYSKCRKNEGIYSALQLQHLFNIDRVNLSGLKKSVTMADLRTFANNLEAKANSLPAGALANALRGHVNNIRAIHKQQVIPLEQTLKYVEARNTLNESIGTLQNSAANLKIKVGGILNSVEAAQYLINNNGTDIVKQEMYNYCETVVGYITEYSEWIEDAMNNEVAVCKPIANAVDASDMILCGFIVDSLNGFWFSLGCCTVFLIPSIIIAVKLAKFYRRMDTEDVYDELNRMPITCLQQLLLLLLIVTLVRKSVLLVCDAHLSWTIIIHPQ
ncbi:prominin-1-A-like isoform X9 [Stegostoma tigrinum]|uniref:prominin-1-A-like isoform X9 n=1 Tax=Stegostoma tigrinum TaxID=3053191 RepID=UPI0028708FB7|nr:prominin-1-A-like isoform X9 [Stegostoma tigrinum]